ncbi:hypothetical protein AB0C02_10170 [Micromonospora sp. NPDC048999]|uniref:hypothetical protein n=1 Tax=Micromonospora sp. NPDC048999 TaxID=3155391 RepID=UPI0033E4E6A1
MTSGNPATVRAVRCDADWLHPVRTGGETDTNHVKASAAMTTLLLLLFLLVLAVAGAVGLTVDTRDSADWKPTDDGRRWSSRAC